MNVIEMNIFNEQSFVDYDVINMNVDVTSNIALIETNGANYIENGSIISLSNVCIKIKNWYAFEANEYDDQNNKFKQVSNYEEHYLTGIYELILNSNEVIFRGFRKHNGWMEWKFLNANIEVIATAE